ncbi:Phosphate regulon transcriptional regulatory protein PhoB [Thalassovita gelatinovora]|uniref:Phosphate regulon transcriptional regulatory protein PhoB n=1 Tax=Thalassovita gelatinovora TaxID=53501 RepID=A0A0P1FZR0_THAGE|nr:fused response regulator/phosphatase [Thalassovita gelatinovora]QIZ81073.1 SpoIIE family protein phosphatase [Thalassovita gelatinovora]CUH64949.1 Phosphate regulon transcriptional regulatory protein PhoB [Thalassovita gelatinovora]SEP89009.1 Serine phosphatase RsbU, regulator of sigma subunit [Thalassovita gelatinovora]
MRVLIVDDSKLQRRILTASLQRWGYQTVEAESAEEALEKCSEEMPDMVLSDWMMPGMDGLDFCQAFRKLPRQSYGYFILLTSKSEKEAVAKGLDCGADDFLTKPVNASELRARLNAGDRVLQMERELTEKNALISQTLKKLQCLYDDIERDLIEAKKLQQSLMREKTRDFGTATVSLLLRSSSHVGGDLVGFFPINDAKMGVYAIDVSGHGISSALLTARLAGHLSSTVPEQNVALTKDENGNFVPLPPTEVITKLNRMVLTEMETEHYFTMLLAELDLETGKVSLAQAGHPYPIVLRADGRCSEIGVGGMPVGLLEDARFEQCELTLNPGDRLIIQSDGITECTDSKGNMLEAHELHRNLSAVREFEGPQFLDALVQRLSEFTGSDQFDDDVSAVLLDYRGGQNCARKC